MPSVKTMNCLLFQPAFKHHIRLPEICAVSEGLTVHLLTILFHKQCISYIPSKNVVDFRKYTDASIQGPCRGYPVPCIAFLRQLCASK